MRSSSNSNSNPNPIPNPNPNPNPSPNPNQVDAQLLANQAEVARTEHVPAGQLPPPSLTPPVTCSSGSGWRRGETVQSRLSKWSGKLRTSGSVSPLLATLARAGRGTAPTDQGSSSVASASGETSLHSLSEEGVSMQDDVSGRMARPASQSASLEQPRPSARPLPSTSLVANPAVEIPPSDITLGAELGRGGLGTVHQLGQSAPLAVPISAPVPPQGAPGGSGRPATALGARASRLQSRRFHRL